MPDRSKVKTKPESLIGGLVDQLTTLERSMERNSTRLGGVLEISTTIARVRDIDQLLTKVTDQLATLVGAEAATLFMHDRSTQELWARVLRGGGAKELRLPEGTGIVGEVFSSGESRLVADAYGDPSFNPDIDRVSGFKTRSLIAVPLRNARGPVLGVIEVLDRRAGVFSTADLVLVEAVASQVASVLDNVLLVDELTRRSEETSRRVRELDALYEVERAISTSRDGAELVEAILSKAMELVRAPAGSVLVADQDSNELFFRAARGEKADALKSLNLKAGQGIAGYVAKTGELVRVFDARDSEHFDRTISKKLGTQPGAVLCVPLTHQGKTLGALELLNKKGGFTVADERLVVLLAGQIGSALALQRARDEELQRDRLAAIGQMLAGVLHDLRTPMTVIGGYADMLATEADPKTRETMAKAIVVQLEQLSGMQKETLAFARGETTVLLRKVYVHVFMEELEVLLRRQFDGTPVELKVQVDYSGAARFDENKLRRAIINLARNALEAMPTGGKFTISVERDGNELVFTAADNGPGIPPAIADRLFGSFVTAGKKNGTGLGLAIVKRIADDHKGTVSVRSKPGKGATFELRIPAGTSAE